jgi:hypothetical protein
MTFEECKQIVAKKYKIGKTLVIGHLPKYYEEAAEIYAESKCKSCNQKENESK